MQRVRKFKNRGQAWEDAEQAVITGMPTLGMRDVFREKHGYAGAAGAAYSHETRAHRRRFDHIFASREIRRNGPEQRPIETAMASSARVGAAAVSDERWRRYLPPRVHLVQSVIPARCCGLRLWV